MTLGSSLGRSALSTRRHVKAGWLVALLSVGVSSMAAAELGLEQLWVRAMPPTQSMTAAYGQLSNQGDTPLTITGASSSVAADTTLHESVQTGDRMRMVPVTDLTLAPGEVVEFKPAGLHLMLTGINAMPATGSEVEICLLSAEDKTCATAIVQRDADSMNHHHH
jgi:copper(I)-binding protein